MGRRHARTCRKPVILVCVFRCPPTSRMERLPFSSHFYECASRSSSIKDSSLRILFSDYTTRFQQFPSKNPNPVSLSQRIVIAHIVIRTRPLVIAYLDALYKRSHVHEREVPFQSLLCLNTLVFPLLSLLSGRRPVSCPLS